MSGKAVVVCLDTLGDLTLRQPLLSGLLDAGLQVRLVVRAGYAALTPFLDSRLGILRTDLDPYLLADETRGRLATLRGQILAEAPDLVVFPAYTRSFGEEWLLRRIQGPRTAAFASPLPAPARAVLATLLPSTDLETPAPVTILAHVAEDDHEAVKNAALGTALLGHPLPEREPALSLPDGVRAEAAALLGALGLTPGRYVIGCPGGTANNRLKGWPIESYAAQVVHLHRRHGLPVLLTGLASESEHLAAVAKAAAERDAPTAVHIGDADRLPLLLGLVAHSRFYLGTDTGPMHFAGALDVPVVAVFGGGHWPRFLPCARRSFVATQGLPCFGCGWECWLNEPACITAIEPEVVQDAIDWILGEGPDERRVHRGRTLDPMAERVLRSALAVHRSHRETWRDALEGVQRDAAARLDAMEGLGRQLEELDAARRQDAETLTVYIRGLEEDSAARLRIIDEMRRVIDGQQAVLSRRSVKLLRLLRLA